MVVVEHPVLLRALHGRALKILRRSAYGLPPGRSYRGGPRIAPPTPMSS
ncbi:MAG: hypothetical protein AVDCRST_MAG66-701 [uncultured Pseudonocardia sp.]|uniref:Uncharacterized protein n=1 Tax=uncultured Pseudonocardia sp. TaxID=211455 RepID=A0A6J4NGS0_9PSEU|nr:MAG: hypothetical protein AVDCRST_MAG66-701 [uncultured Pseudonocardia sp.]